jgi:hypothetical protein
MTSGTNPRARDGGFVPFLVLFFVLRCLTKTVAGDARRVQAHNMELQLVCKVERGKKKVSGEAVVFQQTGLKFADGDEVALSEIITLSLEKFGSEGAAVFFSFCFPVLTAGLFQAHWC